MKPSKFPMVDVDGQPLRLGYEPGWFGGFTRQTVAGALPAGTRVVKAVDEEGDAHAKGDGATVLGSLTHPETGEVLYFVEWDDSPRAAVAVVGWKVAEALK